MGRLLLVRHGQASFGAEDYDVLSETGWEQARLLGRQLGEPDVVPDLVIHGAMRRQRETAEAMLEAAGWDTATEIDPRWDELDHVRVLAAYGDPHHGLDRRAFQEAFERATGRWSGGEAPDVRTQGPEELESYAAFVARVGGALDHAAGRAGPGALVVAVSSGGAIAAAAARLLGAAGPALPVVWSRLNTVLVNASWSTVVVGGTGARLLTYNEHPHLTGDDLTYR